MAEWINRWTFKSLDFAGCISLQIAHIRINLWLTSSLLPLLASMDFPHGMWKGWESRKMDWGLPGRWIVFVDFIYV